MWLFDDGQAANNDDMANNALEEVFKAEEYAAIDDNLLENSFYAMGQIGIGVVKEDYCRDPSPEKRSEEKIEPSEGGQGQPKEGHTDCADDESWEQVDGDTKNTPEDDQPKEYETLISWTKPHIWKITTLTLGLMQ